MSGKIEYDVRRYRRNVCNEKDERHNDQVIADVIDLLGNPSIPRDADTAASLPTVDPSRAWVRFQLTGVFDGGTFIAPAKVIDSAGTDLSPGETVSIYDGIGSYVADAIGSEVGYAQQFTQPDGSLSWEPVRLGGLGAGGGGGGSDVLFKVTADDTTADYFMNKAYNANGTSPVATSIAVADALPGGYQECFVQAVEGSPAINEKIRIVTATGSSTDNYTVKVTTDDTTPQFLHGAMQDPAAIPYDAALHSMVKFAVVGGAATDQKLQAYTEKSTESGKVRVDSTDILEFLQSKFSLVAYVSARADLVGFENIQDGAGRNLRAFVPNPRVCTESGSTARHLADQFNGLTATAYDSSIHTPVSVVKRTIGGDVGLDAYIPKSSIQAEAAVPFTCKLITTLTKATWNKATQRLTPAANTNKALLMPDAGAYFTAEAGTQISPVWQDRQDCVINSGQCKIGIGVLYNGKYILQSVWCEGEETA